MYRSRPTARLPWYQRPITWGLGLYVMGLLLAILMLATSSPGAVLFWLMTMLVVAACWGLRSGG